MYFPLFVLPLLLLREPNSPETMIKMVVRLKGPGIEANSSSAQAKTIYRAGGHYARIEGPADLRQHSQKVTIIAEPDAYSIDLMDKKGTHATDQGGADDLHLPVVLPLDPKHRLGELDRLEFGKELAFFEDAKATKQSGPPERYTVTTPDGPATLTVKPGTHIPSSLSWRASEGTYSYEYLSYEEVPFDPAKFAKPAGVTLREIPPDKGDREK